jgi:hypothetical protein
MTAGTIAWVSDPVRNQTMFSCMKIPLLDIHRVDVGQEIQFRTHCKILEITSPDIVKAIKLTQPRG